MGCDYKLLVQVKHGLFWVTVVDFGTKTRCGGFPLCPAMRNVAKNHGILGNFGVEFPLLPSAVVRTSFFISKTAVVLPGKIEVEDRSACINLPSVNGSVDKENGEEESETEEGKRNNTVELEENAEDEAEVKAGNCEEEPDEEEEEETEKEYEVRYEKEFLYYSKEQFEKLISCIQPLTEYRPTLYIDMMKPVTKWCEMALTALPLDGGEIWMSDEEQAILDVTQSIKDKQVEMLNLYKKFLAKILSALPLPLELVHLVAEFAVGGSEVRVAFKDDEGQSGVIRRGDFSEAAGCVVM